MVSSSMVYQGSSILLLVLILFEMFEIYQLSLQSTPPASTHNSGLTVTTLTFKVPWDKAKVAHNCRMINGTRHRFLIYTDDLNASYCRLCTCHRFIPSRCPPPDPYPGRRNNCEKCVFTARMVQQLGEMVYLDSDLIIMKRDFLDRLYWRSRSHDFLAAYNQLYYGKEVKYYNTMNSGLFFMRAKGADLSKLVPRMYEMKTGFDQTVLSSFVHQYYKHWDSLSWRWHCRDVLRMKQDTPISECYTIHDRTEDEKLLKMINYTLLTIPT